MSNTNEKAQSAFTLDPKEYLKRKGLKNPPIDSGVSGGGDNQPVRPSDMMLEFAKKYSRHKLVVLIEENSKYCNRIAELEAKCQRYEEALDELSEVTVIAGNAHEALDVMQNIISHVLNGTER